MQICCCIIDFLYYFSAYIPNYFTSWIFVVKDWSFVNYNYWSQWYVQLVSVSFVDFL